MCKERRRLRFSQTMASEWQTAFVVSQKMPWCALITAVKNYNRSLEKLQDFFSKTKTKCSRPRPRLSFLSSRRLETNTLVSRTTSLHDKTVFHDTKYARPRPRPQCTRPDQFLVSDRSCPKTDGLGQHHWNWLHACTELMLGQVTAKKSAHNRDYMAINTDTSAQKTAPLRFTYLLSSQVQLCT